MEALKPGYDQSLIEIDNLNNPSETSILTYSFHDLIHKVIRDLIPPEDFNPLYGSAIEMMREIFSGRSDIMVSHLMKQPAHLQHAEAIFQQARELHYSSKELLSLKIRIIECFMGGLRDFDRAKAYIDDIEESLLHGVQIETLDKALFFINKGFFKALYKPDYDAAIQAMNKGLEELSTIDGMVEEKLRAITNLAQYFILLGDNKKASFYILKGQENFENSRSPVYNALYLFACSLLLNDQGKFQESLKVIEKAMTYTDSLKDYPTLEFSLLNQKIEVYLKMHEFKHAKEIIDICLKKSQLFFQGRPNSITANTLLLKGSWLMEKAHNPSAARLHITKALDIYNQVYHEEGLHRNQALGHFYYGRAFQYQKKYKEALDKYLLSEALFTRTMRYLNIDDISNLCFDIAKNYLLSGNKERAKEYLQKHIKLFGQDNERSRNLSAYLYKNGILF